MARAAVIRLLTEKAVPRINACGQNVDAEIFTTIGAYKVFVRVRSNAYKLQCSAWVQVWHPVELKWNMVYSMPVAEMQTPEGMYVWSPGCVHGMYAPQHFQADIDKLLEAAKAILL